MVTEEKRSVRTRSSQRMNKRNEQSTHQMERREETNLLQGKRKIWVSQSKKELLFSKVKEYEALEFDRWDQMLDYVRACVECGFKVG